MGWLGRAEKTTDHHCPLCQGPDLGLAADKLGALVDKRTQGRNMGVWPRQGGARGLAQVHTLLCGITSGCFSQCLGSLHISSGPWPHGHASTHPHGPGDF